MRDDQLYLEGLEQIEKGIRNTKGRSSIDDLRGPEAHRYDVIAKIKAKNTKTLKR